MEELIAKAQKGDKEAFTKIVLSIRNDLYKIAKMRITNEEDIQDIIQETIIETYKSIKKLKDITKFKYWVIKILINNSNKLYRKRKKENELCENYELEFYKEELKNDKNIKLVEDTLNFYEMIKILKYEERMIVVLYYNENYTTKEIGNLLKLNENTVKTKLFRAKEKIKNTYKGGMKIG